MVDEDLERKKAQLRQAEEEAGHVAENARAELKQAAEKAEKNSRRGSSRSQG